MDATDLERGAIGGVAGTLAMSALMLVAGKAGLMGEQPPRRVVDRGAEAAGQGGRATSPRDDRARDLAASVLHLAIGAAAGAGLVALERMLARRGPEMGAAFGGALWASNYLGLAPALDILPRADRDRLDRQLVMLAAHLLYGTVTAMAAEQLRTTMD